MENYTSDSESRNQSCPFTISSVPGEFYILDSVRLNIIASVIINSITSPFITTANFLVCWSIFNNPTLRRNNYKPLLAFLALTDFLMGAVSQPLYIASRICRLKPKCDPCIPDVLSGVSVLVLLQVSCYQVVLLSMERYLAIQHALRYNALVTFKKLVCALAVPWLLSLFCSASYLFVSFWRWILLPLAIISTFFLLYCNIRVLIESKRHHRAIAAQVITLANQENGPQSLSTVSNNALRSEEFKAVKTTLLIVGLFLLFFIITVAVLVPIINMKNVLPATSFYFALQWTSILLRLNSLVNPLVYCWRMREIRQACYNNIRKIFKKSG